MLEVRDLSVNYGDVEIVRRANISVPSGSITVLLGPNGTGKTTFLRAVCGLLPASSGRVVRDGLDVTSLPAHKRGIGMLFQSTQLFPALDVAGNVGFGVRNVLPRLTAKERRQRVDDALDFVGMREHRDADVSSLSGGQCRRVDIARTLAPRPSALLLDEPASMLDADTIARFIPRLRDFVVRHGVSVIYITHDDEEARQVGDSVVNFADITSRRAG